MYTTDKPGSHHQDIINTIYTQAITAGLSLPENKKWIQQKWIKHMLLTSGREHDTNCTNNMYICNVWHNKSAKTTSKSQIIKKKQNDLAKTLINLDKS